MGNKRERVMEKKIKPKYDASYRRGYRDGIIDGRAVSTKALEDYLKLQPTTLVLSADESLQDKIKHLKSLLVRAGIIIKKYNKLYTLIPGASSTDTPNRDNEIDNLLTEIKEEC